MKQNGKTYRQSGSTLIEVILSLSVLTVVILAVISAFVFNMQAIAATKARSIGMALANQKIEDLRNLPYDSLATQFGPIYPPGTILDDENVTVSGIKMRVHIDIDFVDDPYDGNYAGTIAGKPKDLYPYDYKKVTVTIYGRVDGKKYASISTNVAGKVAETASNTGIITVKVVDANGLPVPDATVHITNVNPNPDVDITTSTDSQGFVLIPKMPPDSNKGYHITVSKAGFSSDQTYPVSAQLPVPAHPDFSLQAQQTAPNTFVIDQLASLTVKIQDINGNPLAGASLTITGQKTLNDPSSTPIVYKNVMSGTTDSNGQISFSSIEWDSYTFSISGKTILISSPYAPLSLIPNGNQTATLTVDTSPTSKPTISTVSPITSLPGITETIAITGSNLSGSSTIRLQKAGQSDIVATGISYNSGSKQLTATIDLTSAATGSWDIVLSNASGSVTQPGGFNVAN